MIINTSQTFFNESDKIFIHILFPGAIQQQTQHVNIKCFYRRADVLFIALMVVLRASNPLKAVGKFISGISSKKDPLHDPPFP